MWLSCTCQERFRRVSKQSCTIMAFRYSIRTFASVTLTEAIFTLSLLSLACAQEWPFYGGDSGGTRHSALQQINPGNVGRLRPVWTYHTGEVTRGDRSTERHRIA